jgi:hypothetical protein
MPTADSLANECIVTWPTFITLGRTEYKSPPQTVPLLYILILSCSLCCLGLRNRLLPSCFSPSILYVLFHLPWFNHSVRSAGTVQITILTCVTELCSQNNMRRPALAADLQVVSGWHCMQLAYCKPDSYTFFPGIHTTSYIHISLYSTTVSVKLSWHYNYLSTTPWRHMGVEALLHHSSPRH